ncbi:ABC-2 type transporter [Dethiosulfovibrio peptidovorans DSM 11002]|uniref:ABC-2 type transporter n=1 Tax=Dethiosulfovibrio peptidovorans DSM 11002 TaxID=469381 RepID=D2Z517_9BACT|nr:ABC transporter permease [Dethiosulfovibrio peptidovorans]EFC90576.1 ABC-2 type transporter [Dethiosulfovibrio peptidovorans DSM 11002]
MNLQRLSALIKKEFIHLVRDPRSLALAVAMPVILILLFGYALKMDLKDVPTVVWDGDGSPQSRELISLFDGSPYFDVVLNGKTLKDLEKAIDRGDALVGLAIPADFSEAVLSGRASRFQAVVDGSDATTARMASGYVSALAMAFSPKLAPSFRAPISLVSRSWFNEAMESTWTLVPGVIAIVMVVIAALLASTTIAKEWETGTMEQLISTPIRKGELLTAKIAPYLVIGLGDIVLSVAAGRWLFGVPLRGNPALLFAAGTVFLLGSLLFGLQQSARLRSQLLASQVAVMASYVPTLLMSGYVFSIADMPMPLRWLTYVIPGRYFISILRGIYLKGVGLSVLWLDLAFLALYGTLMAVLTAKAMRMKVD